jgi:menaquinone-dependent protoporphyrinogen IX oxidase
MKALIVYGTRYGATEGTATEIAKVLQDAKIDVSVVNAKEGRVKDISEYGFVIVGSGMALGNWAGETEAFVKKFQKILESKKVALFISSLNPVEGKAGKSDRAARTRKVGLDDKILKYHLHPIMTGLFGGVIDFTKMNFITRKTMELGYKSQLQQGSFKEVEPGVWDLRDWEEIRSWAKELAKQAQE